MANFQNGSILSYYGILDGRIICEATAAISPEIVQNAEGLVGDGIAYLSAFRTKGYFQN